MLLLLRKRRSSAMKIKLEALFHSRTGSIPSLTDIPSVTSHWSTTANIDLPADLRSCSLTQQQAKSVKADIIMSTRYNVKK